MDRARNTCRLLSVLLCLAAVAQVHGLIDETNCSRTCTELNCDSANINYGKYCGIGHGGCKGEEPCDAVDACCKRHDSCVERMGMLASNGCHERFIKCLNKHEKTGAKGFSEKCPWTLVIPTMRSGIELAMALTSMFGGQQEL